MLLGVGLMLAWFTSRRSDKMAELNSASEIAQTSAGEVEFLVRGEGPPVLVFHGAPGGYDQAMLLGAGLADQGFQIIAPSRPGYLRTPLTDRLPRVRPMPWLRCSTLFGAASVAVPGYSSGAPAALEFAWKYPEPHLGRGAHFRHHVPAGYLHVVTPHGRALGYRPHSTERGGGYRFMAGCGDMAQRTRKSCWRRIRLITAHREAQQSPTGKREVVNFRNAGASRIA